MGPLTAIAYPEMIPSMKRAVMEGSHVHIDRAMWNRINDIAHGLPESDLEGRLPSPTTVVEIDGDAAFMCSEHEDMIAVFLLSTSKHDSSNLLLCAYRPRSKEMRFGEKLPDPDKGFVQEHRLAYAITVKLDLLFSLMAEPRFVKGEPVSRMRRNMAAKKIGKKALRHTWTKLSWNLGSPTKRKGQEGFDGPQKAFHMRRAHWRDYGDRQTTKSVRREHRPGWWVWLEATYAGHPALGMVKHHYCPKLDDPGSSSKMLHTVVASKIASGVEKKKFGHAPTFFVLGVDWKP